MYVCMYPANFIAMTDEFINLPTGFGKSLIYQALLLVCDTVRGFNYWTLLLLLFRPW